MQGVIHGYDDYLFLDNDTNRVTEQVRGLLSLSERECHEIAFCHKSRRLFLAEEFGSTYLHIIVPNKEMVLSHLLPDNLRLQEHGLTPVNSYIESDASISAATFYRPNLLRQLHQTEPVFSRTDTHWTHAGAVAYLRRALQFAGLKQAADALGAMPRTAVEGSQLGDLGVKLNLDPEKLVILSPTLKSYRLAFTNEIRNEGCVRFFRNDNAPIVMRVVLMHDSTAMWLLGFLPALFSEIVMIHYPDADPMFLSKYKPDIVLFMQIERFFVRIPKNDVSWASVVAQEEARKTASRSAVEILAYPETLSSYK